MDALINSTLLVAASEMGDKTQLLALLLILKFKKPWAIMSGILVATLLNHGLASWAGGWVSQLVTPNTLRYVLTVIFIAFAFWILIPDKEGEDVEGNRYGAFLTTLVTFFFAEMGDKTQLATIALGAKYQSAILVTCGTTLGMLLADGLAVFFGERLIQRISLRFFRIAACISFLSFGLATFFQLF